MDTIERRIRQETGAILRDMADPEKAYRYVLDWVADPTELAGKLIHAAIAKDSKSGVDIAYELARTIATWNVNSTPCED